MGPRFSLDSRGYIFENGVSVARIVGGGTDEGLRLVGILNLADRDEGLLDKLAEMITSREAA